MRTLGAVLVILSSAACNRPSPPTSAALFSDASQESGLRFTHVNGGSGKFYLPEIMGPGVAVFDYDLDGDLDVYFLQGKPLTGTGISSGNRLFRNELVPTGKLWFADVTAQAGVGHTGYGMGAAVGDYDNDGYPDLFITNFGSNVLYHNNGDGTFTDATKHAGVGDSRWSTSAAFVDYDRDGRLDLFVSNYLNYNIALNKPCYAPTGELDYCNPSIYDGLPSRLFRNEGNGKFSDVTGPSGIGSAIGKALGVVCFDYDRDGWIDIYVANDGVANHLWRNRNGRFEEVALFSGVAYSADGKAQASMGVDAADAENNGIEHLFVTNLIHETNNFYRNDGAGNFVDAILNSGMAPASRAVTGFGTRFFDYDHDGRLDLFVANGAVTVMDGQRGTPHPFRQSSHLFRNEGKNYAQVLQFAPEVSRGAAFGDIDNDGDIDIVVTNNNGPARLWLNQAGSRSPSLQIRLEGVRSNRQGLGARAGVVRRGKPTLWRRAQTDGSYLSASDSRIHFGSVDASEVSEIIVEWPGGDRETWAVQVAGKKFVTLRQGSGLRR